MTENQKTLLTAQSFELSKMLAEIYNARLRASVLINAPQVHGSAKNMLKKVVVNLDLAEKRFAEVISKEGLETMKAQLLNSEDAGQIDYAITMYMALPKGIRDQEETRLEGLVKVYGKK